MIYPRQQLAEVGDPAAHRGDPLGRQLLGIRVQVVRESAQVGVQQQGAVMKTAIMGLSIGGARDLAIPVRGRHQQIVATGGEGLHPELFQG
ncbi:hypothetical protein D3C78_1624190 [compost metagenome]